MAQLATSPNGSVGLSQLSLDDAAELLGWSVVQLRRLIKSGQVRLGSTKETVLWEDVRRLATASHRMTLLAREDDFAGEKPPACFAADDSARLSVDEFEVDRVVEGSCLDWLRRMPRASVQSVVTSPPYWGVRRYADKQETTWADGTTVAFGQEKWPEEYVRHTLEILWRLRKVVREDGVVWWNVGDTYMTRSHVRANSGERLDALEGRRANESWKDYPVRRYSAGHPYLKDKDLTLIPFQIALGAQRLGWWVRAVIIWSKANTLPEPVKDRPTTAHEYILMLTQTRFYKYHAEEATEEALSDWALPDVTSDRRNLRSVWHFSTSSSHGNHVAAFPIELPLRCLRASTDEEDLVFDPFVGSGTTLIAAKQLGCRYFGCDISPTYVSEARERLAGTVVPAPQELPLFNDILT
jgi:site-specific DNA-methyltransferase (cytosine-N4-specific)